MPELTVVFPVFNEEACIVAVLGSWKTILDGLAADYECVVVDDGSTDRTAALLDGILASWPKLCVHPKEHSGHGPTIHRGYQRASSAWILQVDGDGEVDPADFPRLWAERAHFDLVVGMRMNRRAGVARRFVSRAAALSVRTLFGPGLSDVNCPFRLWRGESLRELLPLVPPRSFAPNVLLAGAAIYRGLRIRQEPVGAHPRLAGTSSLFRWGLWRAAIRTFVELVAFAVAVRRSS